FEYNKDADRYICPAGVMSTKGTVEQYKNKPNNSLRVRYRWRATACSTCAMMNECLHGCKTKAINIRVLSDSHREQMEFQKSQKFRELSRERYKIEAKNSELKNAHGYDRADSYGISAMELQGAVTIFVVNLKRIMKMMAK
ncbi:MAG: transposase, partial [Bacteroidales bacterium]|nr:transposase [Bacteroidales bacterium]